MTEHASVSTQRATAEATRDLSAIARPTAPVGDAHSAAVRLPDLDAAPSGVPVRPARWVEWAKLVAIAAQLGLALLLIRQFQLESRSFYDVALLAVGGFAIHALLPHRIRLPFFVALSFASIALVLGARNGAWLVGIGLALIGICHLRVPFPARVALLLACAALLAALRVDWIHAPWAVSVWPILGSMFMFRLTLYLYSIRHDQTPPTVAGTLAYFFMLPNVCFPLYPVVDYQTFTRTHDDADANSTYQTGVQWIVRGLVHLLIYRYVYYHLTGDPLDVATLSELVRYVLATFLLYLRVSGEFHLIVGMLHLFGFRLPETHHLYFLSSSFTDFWRRINIYWKDYMMKLVYYPSFFRLRRWQGAFALIEATLIVFGATWLLHSYQWFWLLGNFPLTLQDVLFWGILGVLVVVNVLHESKRGRNRARGRRSWSASLAFRTVGTFVVISVLWSLWSTASLAEWMGMWPAAMHAHWRDLALVAGLLLGGLAIAGRAWGAPVLVAATRPRPWYRLPALRTTATLLAVLGIGQLARTGRLGPRIADVSESLRKNTLNARDEERQQKGYYEELNVANRFGSELWERYTNKPADWVGLWKTPAYHPRNDFVRFDLRPSTSTIFLRKPLRTNRWGMRDRDYDLAKSAGTFRIALLGPSFVMGSGVADGEPFADVLEARLNREFAGGRYQHYEVLNFGVPGYSLLEQAAQLDERVLAFHPDVVIISLDPDLESAIDQHLMHVVESHIPIPYDGLRAVLQDAGVFRTSIWREQRGRLRRADGRIVEWALQHMAQVSRDHGAVPVAIGLGLVSGHRPTIPSLQSARGVGFLTLDLSDVYLGHDPTTLRIAEWDNHPNALGHRLIADRLFDEIRRHAATLRLDVPAR